ncbi:hypothetical protein XENTR_v10002354 [Xenopus tropicalis]|uniref:Coiled-coil domain-containing protein 74B n=1 Tax=Xenopus tropicalis TaxID=8364 RepID=A0A8J0R024_XENTR|nr:coiled-coil domain-containing protein 74B [Xenopus tropicalis]KAE8634570.1 hypothetical protein XENTR_v10002354 [Xenopus tropicalis]
MSNSSMSINSLLPVSAKSHADPRSQTPPRLPSPAERPPEVEPTSSLANTVSVLEKRIVFLQREHADTLHSLHQEIHCLNMQNSDLKYKLTMQEKNNNAVHSSPANGSNTGESLHGAEGRVPVLRKHQENSGRRKMRQMCTDEEFRPAYTASTHMEVTKRYWQPSKLASWDSAGSSSLNIHQTVLADPTPIVSLKPLFVQKYLPHTLRSPTMMEHEKIIRQLCTTNQQVTQELLQIKAFLSNVIRTEWNKESQTLARAFLKDAIRVPPAKQYSDSVIFPPLRQTLVSNLANRQKKVQAVQSRRLRRVLH